MIRRVVMGEAAQDALDGITCQYCGQWMPEVDKYWNNKSKLKDFFDNPPGSPRTCPDCEKEINNGTFRTI